MCVYWLPCMVDWFCLCSIEVRYGMDHFQKEGGWLNILTLSFVKYTDLAT